MRKKYNKRKEGILLILIALGLLIGGAYVYSTKVPTLSSQIYSGIAPDNNEIPKSQDGNAQRANNEILQQVRDDKTIVQSKKALLKFADQTVEFSISNNTTVYDAMNSLMAEGKLSFEGKEYPGLGFFITSIGSLESGEGKNLMYYINGKEASLGVSSYVVKEGDIIEWKLK